MGDEWVQGRKSIFLQRRAFSFGAFVYTNKHTYLTRVRGVNDPFYTAPRVTDGRAIKGSGRGLMVTGCIIYLHRKRVTDVTARPANYSTTRVVFTVGGVLCGISERSPFSFAVGNKRKINMIGFLSDNVFDRIARNDSRFIKDDCFFFFFTLTRNTVFLVLHNFLFFLY